MSNTLEELIQVMRGSRTWDELSRDCGGSPTGARLQSIAKNGIQAFPGPDTITAIAQGLSLHPKHVVVAAAESLGLWDSGRSAGSRDIVLPRYAETLTEEQMRAIHGVIREFAKVNARVKHGADGAGDASE